VFDRGRIVESGSFDELVAKRGLFAKLAEAQFLAPAAE
jgi:ATP-binding cassette subfamily B protein